MTMIYHTDDGKEVVIGPKKAKQDPPEKPPEEAKSKPEQPTKRPLTQLEAIIILARRGRTEILPKLRELLDKSPELWQHFGNLAVQAQESWLKLIAGKDLYLAETMRRHLDSMRSELAGPHASPLERLLVDRIVAVHVQTLYFEANEGQQPGGQNANRDDYRMRRQDQANRQSLAAVKMLATVRGLMARTIQVELIQRAPTGPYGPIINSANGDQPGSNSTMTDGPVAGEAYKNGHNRVAAILGRSKAPASQQGTPKAYSKGHGR